MITVWDDTVWIPTTLAISNRGTLSGETTKGWASRLSAAGVDALQIREKELSDLCVHKLVAQVTGVPQVTRVLVNERFDVAISCGAVGVHLRSDSVPLDAVRLQCPDLLIGKSVHSLSEVRSARDDGADYVTLSPIFPPLSEKPDGHWPALGLARLEEAARLGLPILALGGVCRDQLGNLARAGSAGFAGITIFQRPQELAETLEEARRLWPTGVASRAAS